MTEGFVVDFQEAGSRTALNWVEGKPEKSFWAGVKLSGRDMRRISAYPCVRCGYLELYAVEQDPLS